jgi:hypothetical protein
MSKESKNVYLEQVLQEQAAVDDELRKRRAPKVAMGTSASSGPASQSSHTAGRAVDYRITGFGLWRTVVVPPNVYVVHTRRGHKEPVHIGMGISFSYRPYSDAFLIIPAAVQTLLINANSICRERQGILVQAYVQWIIDDIKTAYRKLDFSDPDDPMRIVNVQLREQAEAAIKDKVATMSIDEVLSDKQPIIEELTHRLQTVVEGNQDNGETSGLGLKIVTIQIKEAVISSTRLWENLQAPFRAERNKLARLAELESEQHITARELENRENQETEELATEGRLAQLRADKERIQYDREQAEKVRRHQVEQDAARQAITEQNATAKAHNEAQLELDLQALELEKQRLAAEITKIQQQMKLNEAEARLAKAQTTAELEVEDLRYQTQVKHEEQNLAIHKAQRAIENDLSEPHIQAQLIAKLPEIAEQLPAPEKQRTTIISSDSKDGTLNPLLSFVTSVLSMVEDSVKRKAGEDKV